MSITCAHYDIKYLALFGMEVKLNAVMFSLFMPLSNWNKDVRLLCFHFILVGYLCVLACLTLLRPYLRC